MRVWVRFSVSWKSLRKFIQVQGFVPIEQRGYFEDAQDGQESFPLCLLSVVLSTPLFQILAQQMGQIQRGSSGFGAGP